MECPGCGSIIPVGSKQCPLCKYLVQTTATGALPGEATFAALAAGDASHAGSADKLSAQIRPYALPYWPLAGLVGGGVVAVVVIVLLLGNLVQGNGIPLIAPSITATSASYSAASTPAISPTANPTATVVVTSSKGRPTAVPTVVTVVTSVPGATPPVALTPTVTPGLTFVTAIDCGGGASGQYLADTDVVGGNLYSTNAPIDTSGVSDPAPQSVYQTERWGDFTYTLTGLTPGAAYVMRLHFAEIFFNQPNQRQFNVTINDQQVLSNFDIFAAAGGSNKAVVEQFATKANAQGQVVVIFATGPYNNPKCSGIELFQGMLPNG